MADMSIELIYYSGYLKANNSEAIDFVTQLADGEIVKVKDDSDRDNKYNASYFVLLAYIYDLLPINFRKSCPKSKFYIFLKELFKEYNITKIGSLEIKEYTSLAFGRMSQKTFEVYVKNQIGRIYTDVIEPLITNESQYKQTIEWIEDEMEKVLWKLTK